MPSKLVRTKGPDGCGFDSRTHHASRALFRDHVGLVAEAVINEGRIGIASDTPTRDAPVLTRQCLVVVGTITPDNPLVEAGVKVNPAQRDLMAPSSRPVRTADFRSANAGSNPAGVTNGSGRVLVNLAGFNPVVERKPRSRWVRFLCAPAKAPSSNGRTQGFQS